MFVQMQHPSSIFMFVAIVSGRKYSDQLTVSELLNAVHDTFVRADDVVDVVVLAEGLDAVGAELDDVAALVGVADVVGQDALILVGVGGVGPEDVDDEQLVAVLHLVHDLERPLELLDVVQLVERGADAAVQAQDLVVDQRRHRHLLEDAVEGVEDRVLLVEGVLAEPQAALVREAEVVVDVLVLVVAADHVDAVRLLALEREEQAERLQRVRASVHLVAQEQLVVRVDVAAVDFVGRAALQVEELHEVFLLAVDVSEDFDGRLDAE